MKKHHTKKPSHRPTLDTLMREGDERLNGEVLLRVRRLQYAKDTERQIELENDLVAYIHEERRRAYLAGAERMLAALLQETDGKCTVGESDETQRYWDGWGASRDENLRRANEVLQAIREWK